VLLIEGAADGGRDIRNNVPTRTTRNGHDLTGISVFRSGRMEPPSIHDEAEGRKTPP